MNSYRFANRFPGDYHGWQVSLVGRVAVNRWHFISVPLPSRPVTVSHVTGDLIDSRRPSQVGGLGNHLWCLTWYLQGDRPRHGLVQIAVTNTVEGQRWVVWQGCPIRLWLVRRDRHRLVRDCDSDVIVPVGTKGDFTWHFTLSNHPTSWRFIWHLNRLIRRAGQRRSVHGLPMFVHIRDMTSVSVGRVGHGDRLVLAICRHSGFSDRLL